MTVKVWPLKVAALPRSEPTYRNPGGRVSTIFPRPPKLLARTVTCTCPSGSTHGEEKLRWAPGVCACTGPDSTSTATPIATPDAASTAITFLNDSFTCYPRSPSSLRRNQPAKYSLTIFRTSSRLMSPAK